jgi:hypothetical protein
MAPTCFPRQMTLRHSRQALCLLLSRPSGARGPAAPLGFCSKRVWSTDFSCARAGAGLHWLRARRLRAMAQKAQTLKGRWRVRQSRAPPLQTRCRAARLRGTFCRYGWRASQRLLESWRCSRPRVRCTTAAYAHARFGRAHPAGGSALHPKADRVRLRARQDRDGRQRQEMAR